MHFFVASAVNMGIEERMKEVDDENHEDMWAQSVVMPGSLFRICQ